MTDPRFESRAPASPDIFSFATDPLWAEHPSQLASHSDKKLMQSFPYSYYNSTCHRIAGRIPLTFVYGPKLKIALSEISSCFVVRSEHHYNKDERRRLSLRKHVFEMNTDEQLRFSIPEDSAQLVADELREFVANNSLGHTADQLDKLVSDVLKTKSWISASSFYNSVYSHLDIFAEEFRAPILFSVFWPLAEPVLRYRDIEPDDKWGKYLGFVDLRLYSERSPVALALLVPPREYRHDPTVHVITGEYGPIFGGPSFASCTFAMHDPDASGARCAQSAAINALTLLSDRGARLMGGYTLTFLGKRKVDHKTFDGHPEDCLFKKYDDNTTNAFRVHGMTFDELAGLLTNPRCGTSVSRVRMPWPRAQVRNDELASVDVTSSLGSVFEFDPDRLTRRIIQGYVAARCPIILFVESDGWYKNLVPDHFTTSDDPLDKSHAVVIVGFRRSSGQQKQEQEIAPWRDPPPRAVWNEGLGTRGELTELIVNDPGFAPFLKLSTKRCFQAARKFIQQGRHKNDLHMLCVTPDRVKCHALDCITALNKSYQDDRTSGDYSRWLEYFDRQKSEVCKTDFRIELVHRDDIVSTFLHTASYPVAIGPPPSERDDQWMENWKIMTEETAQLKNSWFWCIAGYWPEGLASLWLFDSQQELGAPIPWQLSFHWSFENGLMAASNSTIATEDEQPGQKLAKTPLVEKMHFPRALRCSVLTSCTERPLSNLALELDAVCGVNLLDLFVLREVDLSDLKAWNSEGLQFAEVDAGNSLDPRSSALVMANPRNVDVIADWVENRLTLDEHSDHKPTKIAALATYFPHIVTRAKRIYKLSWGNESSEMTRRSLAQAALTNSVCLALELQSRGIMKHAIIELVAGTFLDECTCDFCEANRQERGGMRIIFETPREEKIRILCWELFAVVQEVKERAKKQRERNPGAGAWSDKWAFAIELEPGTTYVINDTASADLMLKTAEKPEYQNEEARLSDHLGLNFDTAHAKIIQREADALRGKVPDEKLPQTNFAALKDYIVHAHICDTPGMHTRDQPIGSWSPIQHRDADDYVYIDLLTKLANEERGEDQLPFSGAVGLELEGCSRFDWIVKSTGAMKYMFEISKNYPR